MQAVILAEGEGLRLRPLTDTTPKPLLMVAGVPLIQYTIELFELHGVKDIIICTSYRRETIREALGDGSRFGVRMQYSESEQLSGTGGALKKAAWMLEPERFFVTNSDEIKDVDLHKMRAFHEDAGADATIALTEVGDARQFGIVHMDGRRIKEFIEKPRSETPVPGFINSGLYMIEPRVIDTIPSYGKPMLEKEVFPKIAARGKLAGFQFSGRWVTINTLEQYQAAEKLLRN